MIQRILIYAEIISDRLKYITGYLFDEVLGMHCEYTTDLAFFEREQVVKINYSDKKITNSMSVVPNGLLFEKGLSPQYPDVFIWQNTPCFFKTNGEIPFDVFSAAFFLITRYEEYNAKKLDKHGRFCYQESLAFRNNFLTRPIVEEWAVLLIRKLSEKQHVELQRKWRFIPTIDIDNFYKYRGKGLKNIALLVRDGFVDSNMFRNRLQNICRMHEDPYFNFDELIKWHEKNAETIFFFHVGKNGKYDKHMAVNTLPIRYKSKIRQIAMQFQVGLHPSYSAAFDEKKIASEKNVLEKICGSEIFVSRFHFLRFRVPESYRMLCALGFRHDHSMLYAQIGGFRAGTSTPFLFYDVERDQVTHLRIHPTAVMDASLRQYQGLSADEALQQIQTLRQNTIAVGGTFETVFHNERLTVEQQDSEWIKLYKTIIKDKTKTEKLKI